MSVLRSVVLSMSMVVLACLGRVVRRVVIWCLIRRRMWVLTAAWTSVVFGLVWCRCLVSRVVESGGCSACVIIGLLVVLVSVVLGYMWNLVSCVSIPLCVVCVVLGRWLGCSWSGVRGSIVSSVVLVRESWLGVPLRQVRSVVVMFLRPLLKGVWLRQTRRTLCPLRCCLTRSVWMVRRSPLSGACGTGLTRCVIRTASADLLEIIWLRSVVRVTVCVSVSGLMLGRMRKCWLLQLTSVLRQCGEIVLIEIGQC